MKNTWKKLSDREGPDLKYLKTHYQEYLRTDTNEQIDILVVSSADAANVIPITPDLEVILVYQYRFGIEDYTLEIPGGLIESGEETLIGIQRELIEETGYTSNQWKSLGKFPFNPVYHQNFIHHFLAENVELTQETNFDLGEEIELIKLPLAEVLHQVKQGKLAHPHTVSAFMLAYDYLNSITH